VQVTGSFKVRGAFRALARRARVGATSVVAASAGNHGAGVAYVARALGVSATIVVPASTPKKKLDAITALGGDRVTLLRNDGGYDAAEAEAIRLAAERGEPFVSPYDDLDVVLGNGATLAAEIHEGVGLRSEAIVLTPFGGGGLATGLACGFARARRQAPGEARAVWGLQTEASPSFAMSLERRAAVVSFEGGPTLAEGLEGGLPERAFARAAGVVAGVAVVSEESVAAAMRFAFRELGLVLEGSAAVALVPVLEGRAAELAGGLAAASGTSDASASSADVVCVLTGRNVDPTRLAALL
jgi:threonine dehydratase